MATSKEPNSAGAAGPLSGWHKLLEGHPWFRGAGQFYLPAYSEFMPPPRLGRLPYEDEGSGLFAAGDAFGWPVAEIEEEYELQPGLEHLAGLIVRQIAQLGQGLPAHHIAGHKGQNLVDNPYWPPELASHAGRLHHERYVTILPLALSRTQDDKGNNRWTLFGASHDGPARAFWRSLDGAPPERLAALAARLLGVGLDARALRIFAPAPAEVPE